MKRQALIAFVAGVVIIVVSAYTEKLPEVTVATNTAGYKSTCLNGFDSLKTAQFQKKMLDRQTLLSKASGRLDEAAIVGVQVSELNAFITVLEELIADPKLGCKKYLKDTPKLI